MVQMEGEAVSTVFDEITNGYEIINYGKLCEYVCKLLG